MNPLDNPFSKESRRQFQPGNRKKQSNQEKGAQAEKAVAKDLGGRRQSQAGPGGGLSRGDVEAGEFTFEVKDDKKESIAAWIRRKCQETPPNKKPGLVFQLGPEQWVTVKMAHRKNFAEHVVNQENGEVIWP